MKFLIVTGLSGAGKTSVLKHLEDSGYTAIDNLPPALLREAFTLCEKAAPQKPVALGVDSRCGALFDAQTLLDAMEACAGAGHDASMLFLEADEETLISRYKETRRDHPLAVGGMTLESAIAREREMLQLLREHANHIVATGGLRAGETCARVDELIAGGQHQALRCEIMSFGYKRGIPRESDLVLDVRFLPNPFYMKEIRAFTGLEAPVRDFVLGKEETQGFLARLYGMVDYLVPLYRKEGKRRLMIAIGCTGGAHRSVAISEALGEHLRDAGQVVSVTHRDIEHEKASWAFRRDLNPDA